MSTSFSSFTSSSPMKSPSSPFNRWKKADLLDLINKLKISDIPTSTRKYDLIEIIQDYLIELGKPLDYDHEFPELKGFYKSTVWLSSPTLKNDIIVPKRVEDAIVLNEEEKENQQEVASGSQYDSKIEDHNIDIASKISSQLAPASNSEFTSSASVSGTSSASDSELDEITSENETNEGEEEEAEEEEAEEEEVGKEEIEIETDTDTENENESKNFNNLNFKTIDQESSFAKRFKFNFHECINDIVDKTSRLNRYTQDSLSTVASVDFIFHSIEFIVLFNYIFKEENNENCDSVFDFIVPILIWLTFNILMPIFVSYYVNFVRYEYYLEIDPMVFHLAKGLIAIALFTTFKNGNNNKYETIKNDVEKIDLDDLKHALGSNKSYSSINNALTQYCQVLSANLITINQALGIIPLVFAITGSLLTLYVLI
ncbi:Gtt3p NDAI_0D01340 [Naumovozyma dairenensis CBS 421]|uniref:SAP domain-containing protein n=1 Tax=Naumovozyma dairenensis (strain ATCC 10597 / BCRC 20456 / CBS 421 / NBRC 0211 / NRRL Y-12639) TaxID=1071378 RepID=G0W9I7_NAUDC|nr:hypothetical protein NDAI_0D01340 [Naumovozyma dairenensis CBS 421]CCD24448.1 hypothetical protein NDAI_0D01340 [Naumovozyma dairenensis CBS 421]